MLRESKKKIASVFSVAMLCIVILVLVFIGVCVVADNISNSNVSAKENTSIETASKNDLDNSKDGLVLVKEVWAESNYGDYSHRYYKDSVTGVMFIDFANKPLIQMEDPATGLPLTYEKYLEYQNEK